MKISRREGIRLRNRVVELDGIIASQRRSWTSEWPSSKKIATLAVDDVTMAKVSTARHLEHAVVVIVREGKLEFWADRIRNS